MGINVWIVVYLNVWIVVYLQRLFYFKVIKSELQIPESAQLNTLEYGSCSVSTWPRPPINSVKVYTKSDSCKVETLSD